MQPDTLAEAARILREQQARLAELSRAAERIQRAGADARIEADARLADLGVAPPETQPEPRHHLIEPLPPLREWNDLLADTAALDAGLRSLLSPEEIKVARAGLARAGVEALAAESLDHYDYMVAGLAGVLAGLVDVLLVAVPRHPGFLGSSGSPGGWLSNVMHELVGEMLPLSTVRGLEREFHVAYDPSTNAKLSEAVPGLGPRTHRFQSPGHDPILGWVFGVHDILSGSFSAIGKDGSFIVQTSPSTAPLSPGEDLFVRIFEALRHVGGHFLSDVATPAGLPAPLMPLAQFLQFGTIGARDYSIAEVARQMYRAGYDFRHFLAGSVATTTAEVIVRGAWMARRVAEGAEVMDALPLGSIPRLRRTLFLAHLGASAVNAGKVVVTQNPLSLNWAQWLVLFRYLVPEARRVLGGDASTKERAMESVLRDGWHEVRASIDATWTRSGKVVVAL